MLPPRVLVLGKLHQSQMRSRDSTKSNYGIVSQHEMSDFCRMMMMVIIIIVVMIDYDGDSGRFGDDDDDDDEN